MTPTPIKSGARLVYQGGTFNEIHAALTKLQRERNEKILLPSNHSEQGLKDCIEANRELWMDLLKGEQQ
jgi:hypothetical protein